MLLYVAGPMRGHKSFNFPAFARMTATLRQLGHEVLSPAEADRDAIADPDRYEEYIEAVHASEAGDLDDLADFGFDLQRAMQIDLAFIVTTADGVVVLPGWELSSGARVEVLVAQTCGKQIWTLFKGELFMLVWPRVSTAVEP